MRPSTHSHTALISQSLKMSITCRHRVRAGELIHGGSPERARASTGHARRHAQTIHQRPPPTPLHFYLARSRPSPSAIPLFESNFMCQRGA